MTELFKLPTLPANFIFPTILDTLLEYLVAEEVIKPVFNVKLPLELILPSTVSLLDGEDVPIPTFPLLLTVKWSSKEFILVLADPPAITIEAWLLPSFFAYIDPT